MLIAVDTAAARICCCCSCLCWELANPHTLGCRVLHLPIQHSPRTSSILVAETKKDTYEFKRDIIIAGEDPRTGRTNAEKVIR